MPIARRTLDRILRDEVRHRDFGWVLLGWLFDLPIGSKLRALVAAELPSPFRRLRSSYAPALLGAERAMSDQDKAWGLMPISRYRAAVDKALARDWRPRFAKVGIDAAIAWAHSD